jgi:hypothetical protein
MQDRYGGLCSICCGGRVGGHVSGDASGALMQRDGSMRQAGRRTDGQANGGVVMEGEEARLSWPWGLSMGPDGLMRCR